MGVAGARWAAAPVQWTTWRAQVAASGVACAGAMGIEQRKPLGPGKPRGAGRRWEGPAVESSLGGKGGGVNVLSMTGACHYLARPAVPDGTRAGPSAVRAVARRLLSAPN